MPEHYNRKRSVNVASSQGYPNHPIRPSQPGPALLSDGKTISSSDRKGHGKVALTSTKPVMAQTMNRQSPACGKNTESIHKVNAQRSICDLRYESHKTFVEDKPPAGVEKFPRLFSSAEFKARLQSEGRSQYLNLDMHLGEDKGRVRITKVTIYDPETGRQESLELERRPEHSWSYTGGFSLEQLRRCKPVWQAKGSVRYLRASQAWEISIDAVGPGMEYTLNGRGHLSESYSSLLNTLPVALQQSRPVRIKLLFVRVRNPDNGFPERALAGLAISVGQQETAVVEYDEKHMILGHESTLSDLISSLPDAINPYFPSDQHPFAYEGLAHLGTRSSSPFPVLFITNIQPLYMIGPRFVNALTRYKAISPKARHKQEHNDALGIGFIDRFMCLFWPYLHETGDGRERNSTCWLQFKCVTGSKGRPPSVIPTSIAYLDQTDSLNVFDLLKNKDWFDIKHTFDYHKKASISYTAHAELRWRSEADYRDQPVRQPVLRLHKLKRIDIDFPN